MNKRMILMTILIGVCCFLNGYATHADVGDLPSPGLGAPKNVGTPSPLPCRPCEAFHELNTQIRDERIPEAEATRKFMAIMEELDAYARENRMIQASSPKCIFPLQGYTSAAIGGKNGSGYHEKGYNYFDGNAHTGHPAYDLFIRDVNQDSLDDVTGKPVQVLAMESGLVVSTEPHWEKGSRLRGGRYLWIYNPRNKLLTYYAHNENILVRVGDWANPGDPIATVGRTGYNASRKRSPTHLHLMCLKITNGLPRPENRLKAMLSMGNAH